MQEQKRGPAWDRSSGGSIWACDNRAGLWIWRKEIKRRADAKHGSSIHKALDVGRGWGMRKSDKGRGWWAKQSKPCWGLRNYSLGKEEPWGGSDVDRWGVRWEMFRLFPHIARLKYQSLIMCVALAACLFFKVIKSLKFLLHTEICWEF